MNEPKWQKIDRVVNSEGRTVTYWLEGTSFTVESRKRHIRKADGCGTWDFTSYFVMKNGEQVSEQYSLQDAKEYAEDLAAEPEG